MRLILISVIVAAGLAACNGNASEKKPASTAEAIPVKLLPVNAVTYFRRDQCFRSCVDRK
jgi:hypothetical protein